MGIGFHSFQGIRPLALLLPDEQTASNFDDLQSRCTYLSSENIAIGNEFRDPEFIGKLNSLDLDFILGIHFPYIVPDGVLAVSGQGFLNLHPAFLPYNRGWHGPTWGILEDTPAGATLHFMDSGLDTGDIVCRKELPVAENDTADTLYRKLKRLELEVFEEAWPQLLARQVTRIPQRPESGTFHKRQDLFQEDVQKIDLDEETTARQLLKRLRR